MTLEGTLETNVSADGVAFRFTVTNASDEPIELQFSDACKADFAVLEDGQEVWRFSDGRMFAQMLSRESLGPDETTTYDAEWDDPESGEYTAVAELRAREESCEAQTDLSV